MATSLVFKLQNTEFVVWIRFSEMGYVTALEKE
jgi:hypothetical protein